MMSNGAGFKFTSNDYNWCTNCNIYFLTNILNDGRYYITITASAGNPVISAGKSYDKFVNTL